jgi:hypothetical protein
MNYSEYSLKAFYLFPSAVALLRPISKHYSQPPIRFVAVSNSLPVKAFQARSQLLRATQATSRSPPLQQGKSADHHHGRRRCFTPTMPFGYFEIFVGKQL